MYKKINNNPAKIGSENTPKMTMSGYLFGDKRWGCKRISSLINKQGDYYAITGHDKSFRPRFLFSKASLPCLQIKDILDKKYYDVETV